jgi:hypothetical protein
MLDVLMTHYGKLAAIPKELHHFHALQHAWLGHRNINNTMVYLSVANIRLDAAAEKLANW